MLPTRLTLRSLIGAGLLHHARTHLGVMAGAAISAAVLVGALAVGDSVRHTLRGRAAARIGAADVVLAGGERFFRSELAAELGELEKVRTAPVVLLPAVAGTPRGDRRALDARLVAVDPSFFALSPDGQSLEAPPADRAFLSSVLARDLAVDVGDAIVVRVEQPSAIPRDLSLSPDDNTVALRLEVARILTAGEFAEFALDGSPAAPANLFVNLAWAQGELGIEGRANLILADLTGPEQRNLDLLAQRLRLTWTLDDAGLWVESLSDGLRELVPGRIFFDPPVVEALQAHDERPLTGVFTYFVNRIAIGDRSIPYSMVSGLGPLNPQVIATDPLLDITVDLEPGKLRLNEWARDDLVAVEGERVTLEYFVVDASRRLVTQSAEFEYAGSLRIEGSASGVELMPDFPGLSNAEHCREWEPGTPVDLDAIHDEDEAYWEEYKGTPKAFLTLADSRELWDSRFGALTGVRFTSDAEETLLADLRSSLTAAEVGLVLRDVRTPAEASADSPTDFGGLFLGLSFFLIVAALLLTTQLFLFGVEGRAAELGLYSAVGFPASRVRRVLLGETACVALIGVLVGIPLGLLYTWGVLHGLETLWADAVAKTRIVFHAEPLTVAIGAGSALATTLLAVLWGLRRALGRSALELLSSRQGVAAPEAPVSGQRAAIAAGLLLAVALLVVLAVDAGGGPQAAGAFFGAGAAALTAGVVGLRWVLRRARAGGSPLATVRQLGTTNATRRPGRSLATAMLMAIGTFLVLAIGVNRLGPVRDVHARDAGTGGFAFYGRTSIPLLQDLESVAGRDFYALDERDLEGVSLVRMRVRDGDEASCLNLSRPAAPRLLGVDPAELAARGAFPFAKMLRATDDPWLLLDEELEGGAVPAIGDATSLTWQLKKGLGDVLDYTDERGRTVQVQIVAALSDTVLQGDLIIAERRFEELFPTSGGYRRLLIDAPAERADEVAATLTRALEDVGLFLEPTGARLEAFHAVQNTYLSIFQLLGALGLLLGSVGLGLLVLRNTQERRAELALMGALGFAARRVRAAVLAEYGGLLVAGLLIGLGAALVAILPTLRAPGGGGSPVQAALLTVVILGNGLVWIALAVRLVTLDSPLDALREE